MLQSSIPHKDFYHIHWACVCDKMLISFEVVCPCLLRQPLLNTCLMTRNINYLGSNFIAALMKHIVL